MDKCVPIALRSSVGVKLTQGAPNFDDLQSFREVQSRNVSNILFSPSGQYFAYTEGQELHIFNTDTWKECALIESNKAYHLSFSPKDTYLMTWEPFVINKENPEGFPNLKIYKSDNGELVNAFVHKKQTNWEPQFSSDEILFSKQVGTDVLFYETPNFDNYVHKLAGQKISTYSLSTACAPYYLLCHISGTKGQPSFAKLFKYPNFENQQVLATRSFFQANSVEYYWDSKGLQALLLTITDVDKTGESYYGKQSLHLIGTNRETSMVTLSKDGPIYSVAWSPKSNEFCVVYGTVPARATIFNLKCESIFELGAGPRNVVHYNPHGNLLLIGGFGNLRGQIEIWDVKGKKIIGKCDAPDTTLLEWCPNGIHFLTATTAPRLKMSNGYKIWHYSGSLLHENLYASPDLLYQAQWQPFPKKTFREPILSYEKVESITPSGVQASKEAYRPPSARNRPAVQFKLHDDEPAQQPAAPSKAALKQRKKRENKKAKKLEEDEEGSPIKSNDYIVKPVSSVEVSLTGDAETDKKIKNIKKKLDAIAKLKEQQKQGKTLEVNQLSKIQGEPDLLRELQQLQL